MTDEKPISLLLNRWSEGDKQAFEELTPLVYDELKRLAQNAFRREHGANMLQATALVNEAYLQLVNAEVDWKSRSHFFALSARMMRRILINHANAQAAEKRGGDAVRVTLHESVIGDRDDDFDVIDLDQALTSLADADERTAEIVELHYFGGMTYREAGAVLDVSEATAKRSLRFGKAWMRDYLENKGTSDG
ncbi:MAG: ECF-type sigma factor [Pseudomonadota bacterium]